MSLFEAKNSEQSLKTLDFPRIFLSGHSIHNLFTARVKVEIPAGFNGLAYRVVGPLVTPPETYEFEQKSLPPV